jgi:hypothetical protein
MISRSRNIFVKMNTSAGSRRMKVFRVEFRKSANSQIYLDRVRIGGHPFEYKHTPLRIQAHSLSEKNILLRRLRLSSSQTYPMLAAAGPLLALWANHFRVSPEDEFWHESLRAEFTFRKWYVAKTKQKQANVLKDRRMDNPQNER